MRWSALHAPTLRSHPAEAEAPSHRLLVRAGFIRQLAAGHYSLLPLAMRVRAKIMTVIREELERIGAQEFLLPSMHPAEIWQESGRWDVMGAEMFRLTDRKQAQLALGMTHEEIFTTVARELNSYRQLPQIWYQFQTKFRDEPRPKSGLLRVREFTMKDSYSFDLDVAGLDANFDKHRDAYLRIFERLGIAAIAVTASNGTMGGWGSTEFMVPAAVGEDLVLRCLGCGYAANAETADSRLDEYDDGPSAAVSDFDTPQVRTIADLTVQHGVAADYQIKTLVYVIDDVVSLVLLRGDHDLVEQKLVDATGAASLRPAEPSEIADAMGASAGSLGAVGVKELPILADEALRGRANLTTGANRDGVHVRGVDIERDIEVNRWLNLRRVEPGDACPCCGQGLEQIGAVEIGHIFKLGTKYTDALDARVLDADGNSVPIVMGSYGIGVERAIAVIVEAHHDEAGIKWPIAVAPFTVAVVMLSTKDDEVREVAENIYSELSDVDVILDDRDARPGAKFTDIELVGIPYRITVGARGLKNGTVEITSRADGETEIVPVAEAAGRVRALLLDNLWKVLASICQVSVGDVVTDYPGVVVDELAEHLVQLVTGRMLDPLAILLESEDAVAVQRSSVQHAARGWAATMLDGDRQAAVMLAVRFLAVLYPDDDEPVEPSRRWWATPLGRVVAWRLGHPSRRHVSYEVAGAMLGITRQGVGDLVSRGKLRRHADGGVDTESIRERIDYLTCISGDNS